MNPISTYRIQFHKGFTFSDFENIIPYLKRLGVSTVYASPIFESVPGSTHGYDGINPHKINPELGDEIQLKDLSRKLKKEGIRWLQDIVPNHMAFHPDNPWLMDVLEKGRQSVYASFFDINWASTAENGKVMIPFLGEPAKEAFKNNLRLSIHSSRLVFQYYDVVYPLNPRSYATILSSEKTNLQDVEQLINQLENIHQVEDPQIYNQQWNEFLIQFSALIKNPQARAFIDSILGTINNDESKLQEIADEQNYALSYWKETDRHINFRRFFTVNGLICLNIQDDTVFEHFHSYIKSLIDLEVFQGLRIDHIDGLSDPEKYLNKLRELSGEQTYIVTEKILEQGEELSKEWPIQGNTGYDFLGMVNNLFTDKEGKKEFTKFYTKLNRDKRSVHEHINEKKSFILYRHMSGELENLYQLFLDLELIETGKLDSNLNIKSAIAEFLINCPVYRHYGNVFPLKQPQVIAVQDILKKIRISKPQLGSEAGILEEILLIKPLKNDVLFNTKALKFYQRCMQFTGPLMAKGVEDTVMYTYNRFIGHNEVGDSPEAFGYSAEEFHNLMIMRQKNWPLSLNGTSTHDTKRGEDVRARLNVLTEISEDWTNTINQWRFLNTDLSKKFKLDPNDEYFIYQTLVGAMPMQNEDGSEFENRIHEYMVKALREGKQNSDWAEPDEQYETVVKHFVSTILNKDNPFFRILQKFNRKIGDFGIINSLSQVVLKFTCPGVPDIYQGCELWDLNLVDPDNRRPVDYHKREVLLENLQAEPNEELYNRLWENRSNGQIKLWLTTELLKMRQSRPEFFEKAQYIPLNVKGKFKEHVFAFARRLKHEWIVVAVPLHLAKLSKQQKRELKELKWKNTRIILPDDAPQEFENIITRNKEKRETDILIRDIFRDNLPIAVLKLQHPVNTRGAGILMHITSLPSAYGIGDFGPEAFHFAEYLSKSRQKFWQILPLGPTEEGQFYSPYSAISSMAGNTLLISPELLAKDGLLEKNILNEYQLKEKSRVDYAAAKRLKDRLFDEAYHNFCNNSLSPMHSEFNSFCDREADWLEDFALYVYLKHYYDGKPWYEWPEKYKLRNENALKEIALSQTDALNKIKWLQYLFLKQWTALKTHCSNLGIKLIGDLPFYVGNDSSDVWANKEIFCLDEEGKITGIAGVPPDYFNTNGQLWGMPVFKWDVLKNQHYNWWIERIKKNMQLYDLLRLDHFRAFSSYWNVPEGAETAIIGEWKAGPGSDLFHVLKQKIGELPFIAEDLGDVDQPVYDLRDEFNLPGMRVIQFTFGDDLAKSVHTPHNYNENAVVYTGTHDNNTSRGWFKQDADTKIKKNIKAYSGNKVKEKKIHLSLAQIAYSTVANIVILPMQDIIGLDESSRMNTPASVENNWVWRLKSKQLKGKYSRRLRKWVEMYNR